MSMEGDLHKQPHSTPKDRTGQHRSSRSHLVGSESTCGKRSPSYSLEDTGESTRSLLSVLSHSSIQDLAEDVLAKESHDSSGSASPSSCSSSSSSSSQSKSQMETCSRSSASTRFRKLKSATTTTSSSSDKSPPLSPWEWWLIQKTKEERKQFQIKIKVGIEEKLKAEQERKMKEARERIIKAKVNVWVEEKNDREMETKKASARLQKIQRDMEEEEKKRIAERAEVSLVEWAGKKKTLHKRVVEKKLEEQQAKEDAERARKEKAKEAYQAWYKEAMKKPKPVPSSFGYSQGMLKGYHDTATYPIPSFYNPMPWMPIHVPQSSQEKSKHAGKAARTKTKRGPGGKNSALMQIQQPLSPPLLFKDRSSKESVNAWGRPR